MRNKIILEPKELKEILIEYYKNQGIEVKKIDFEVCSKSFGYGMSERDIYVFDSVEIDY